MSKFICSACKKEQEYVLMDGYWFGDRLLEGVMFRVSDDDGTPRVEIDPNSEAYFNDLNTERWMQAALEFVEDGDCYNCPTCGYDVIYNFDEERDAFVGDLTDPDRFVDYDEQHAKQQFVLIAPPMLFDEQFRDFIEKKKKNDD